MDDSYVHGNEFVDQLTCYILKNGSAPLISLSRAGEENQNSLSNQARSIFRNEC
jgi:hypothetical protein